MDGEIIDLEKTMGEMNEMSLPSRPKGKDYITVIVPGTVFEILSTYRDHTRQARETTPIICVGHLAFSATW